MLTLVRGRRSHLVNLIKGLALQTEKPSELVIAYMQDEAHEDLPDPGFPVRSLFVPGDRLPLAAARNAAAEAATGDLLIFLDVDCIPSPPLVKSYASALASRDALYLSEVFYLPAGAVPDPLDFDTLDCRGEPHPSKPEPPAEGVRSEPDLCELWGLCFGLRKSRWDHVGGMDPGYTGYGGEETDLAAKLAALETKAYWVADARAYHQHHEVHVPPLHHFEEIIRNARRFHEKWDRFPMTYWLGQFAKMGLIRWSDDIEILRYPRREEVAASLAGPDVLFS
ncbi:sugar transferase [Pacificimonas flava]|uniref:Sugar transferase n=1 Tax=Pacificimonas flava TaxID=1234595 RepID=A0A219BAI4_9SPHN|nr:sugar transferase [Pacificimonas flava]